MEKTLKIVVLGLSGKGKSATGNTILGKNIFESKISQDAVTHNCCIGKSSIDLEGERFEVQVVDTPGLFDGETKLGEIGLELLRGLEICPNPDAFLIVLEMGRITDLDILQFSTLTCIFGKEIFDHSIIVYTHGDKLTESKYIEFLQSSKIQEYTEACSNRVARIENSEPIVSRNADPVLRLVKDLSGQQGPFELQYKEAHVSALKSLASTYDESQKVAEEVSKLYAVMQQKIKEEEQKKTEVETRRVKEQAEEETRRVKEQAEKKTRHAKEQVKEQTRRAKQAEEQTRRAKEKAEEETRRAKQAEEETRHAKEKAEEESRRAKEAEEETRRAKEKVEEETRRAKQAEEETRRAKEKAEEETRRAQQAEEETRRAKENAEEEMRRAKEKAEEETRLAKEKAEEETRRAKEKADEETRRAKQAEEETRRAKEKAEEETRRARQAEEETRRAREQVEEVRRERGNREQAESSTTFSDFVQGVGEGIFYIAAIANANRPVRVEYRFQP